MASSHIDHIDPLWQTKGRLTGNKKHWFLKLWFPPCPCGSTGNLHFPPALQGAVSPSELAEIYHSFWKQQEKLIYFYFTLLYFTLLHFTVLYCILLYRQFSMKPLLILSSLLSPFSSSPDCSTATIKLSEHKLLLNEISPHPPQVY